MFPKHQSGFEIVGHFYRAQEAHLARAFLESEGIQAWILDEHQIRMQWHLAAALGGVKVAVRPADAARARALLAEDRSAALREVAEQQLPPAPEERCPLCGSAGAAEFRVRKLPKLFQLFVSFFFVLWGYLVPLRRVSVHRQCDACGYAWSATVNR